MDLCLGCLQFIDEGIKNVTSKHFESPQYIYAIDTYLLYFIVN